MRTEIGCVIDLGHMRRKIVVAHVDTDELKAVGRGSSCMPVLGDKVRVRRAPLLARHDLRPLEPWYRQTCRGTRQSEASDLTCGLCQHQHRVRATLWLLGEVNGREVRGHGCCRVIGFGG